MTNYIFTIAKKNIKKDKKLYKFIFISIFLTFFLIIITNLLTSSFQNMNYMQNIKKYGEWDAAFYSSKMTITKYKNDKLISTESIQIEKNNKYISDMGYIHIAEEVIYDGQNLGNICTMDKTALQLSHLHIKDGRLPHDSHEIIVEEKIKEKYNLQLNQQLHLTYQYNNKKYVNDYKLVGIIENYTTHWAIESLTFITNDIESHKDILLFKSNNVYKFWNEYLDISSLISQYQTDDSIIYGYQSDISVANEAIHPEYKKVKDTNMYTNESNLLQNILEITIIAFISTMATNISSLDKRERQFIMLRSIGMTYKQLQRLIIYEGIILSAIAFFLSVLISIPIGIIIVWPYSLISHITFSIHISFISLIIELFIISCTLLLGIILPTLTIYDLPLTRRNGEYYYHPKKNKINKPTFINQVKHLIYSHLSLNIMIIISFTFLLISSASTLIYINNYNHQQIIINSQTYEGDYICDDNLLDSPLQFQNNIHIMSNEKGIFTNDKNESTIFICIDYDEKTKKDIHYKELKDNEGILLYSDQNHRSQKTSYNKVVQYYDAEKDKYFNSTLHIIDSTQLSQNISRNYFSDENNDIKDFVIVVNEKTYHQLAKDSSVYYTILNGDDDIARSVIMNYLSNHQIKYTSSIIQKEIMMHQLNEE